MFAATEGFFGFLAVVSFILMYLVAVAGLCLGAKVTRTDIGFVRQLGIAFVACVVFTLVGFVGDMFIQGLSAWCVIAVGTMTLSNDTRNGIDAGFHAMISGGITALLFFAMVTNFLPWLVREVLVDRESLMAYEEEQATEEEAEDEEIVEDLRESLALPENGIEEEPVDPAEEAVADDDVTEPATEIDLMEAEDLVLNFEAPLPDVSEAWGNFSYEEVAFYDIAATFSDPTCPYEVTVPTGWTRLGGEFSLGLKSSGGLEVFVFAELVRKGNMEHALRRIRGLRAALPELRLENERTVSLGGRSWAYFELLDPQEAVHLLLTHSGRRGTYSILVRGNRDMLDRASEDLHHFLLSFRFPADNILTAQDRPGAVRVIPPRENW